MRVVENEIEDILSSLVHNIAKKKPESNIFIITYVAFNYMLGRINDDKKFLVNIDLCESHRLDGC